MPWDDPWNQTINSVNTYVTNQQAIAAQVPQQNAQTASLLAQHANATPWVDPKVLYAQAASGIAPTDPTAQAISQKSINKKGGGFWSDIGHIVTAPLRVAGQGLNYGLQGLAAAGADLKPVTRGLLSGLETPLQVGMGALRDVASATGDIGAGIASGAATGAAVGLAGGPLAPIGVLAGALGGAAVGGVAGAIGQARGVKIQGGYVNPLSQSTGGQVIGHWLSGKPVDMGTGFMPGGQIHQDVIQAQQNAASIQGHALTPGRFLADTVLQPGSTPYNLLSGMADALTTWELDPAARTMKEWSAAGEQSGKILEDQSRAQIFMQKMGLLHANAPAVDAVQAADNYVATDPAVNALAEKLTGITSANAVRDAMGGKITSTLANDIAAADNPQAVKNILSAGIQQGLITEKSVFDKTGSIMQAINTVKSSPRLARYFADMPGGHVDLLDAFDHEGNQVPYKFDKAVDKVKDWLLQARVGAGGETIGHETTTGPVHQEWESLQSRLSQAQETVASTADQSLKASAQKQIGMIQSRLEEIKPGLQAELGGVASETPQVTRTQQDIHNDIIDKLMQSRSSADFKDVVRQTISDHLTPALKAAGHSDAQINGVLNGYYDTAGQVLKDAQDEIGQARTLNGTVINGKQQVLPKANYIKEFLDSTVALPNARAVKQLTTPTDSLRTLYNSGLWDTATGQLDRSMKVWKALNIIRPAWATRILAMESMKGVMAGLDMPLTHPLKLIGNLVSGTGVTDATDAEGLLARTAEQQQSMVGLKNAIHDPNSMGQFLAGHVPLTPEDDGFGHAWAAHLLGSHMDPVEQRIAEVGASQAFDDFWGLPIPGKAIDLETGTVRPTEASDQVKKLLGQPIPEEVAPSATTASGPLVQTRIQMAARLNRPDLLTYDGAANYFYNTALDRVNNITKNDPSLLEAIATGHLPAGEESIPLAELSGKTMINDAAAAHLQQLGIDKPGQLIIEGAEPHASTKATVQELFRQTTGIPLNRMVRIPAFNQYYWEHMTDTAHLLTPEAQATMLENAAKPTAQLATGRMEALQQAVAKGSGNVELKDASQLARFKATDSMHDLFMDFSHKAGWQDAMRTIVPFASHWQQEATQWAKILTEHPESLRKLQLVTNEGQSSGFFYKNDQGQWVFNYPGSGLIGQVAAGTPFPMQAKVSGLSAISSSLLPGFGPMVSIAASKVLPNKPQFDEVKKLFAPYGDPTQQGVAESVLPPWLKSVQNAVADPKSDVQFGNTVMETARYLMTTGKYEVNTPEGQDKLISDATNAARKVYLLRAAGQFVSPSSPTPVFEAKDPNGNLMVAKAMSADLAQMESKDINTAVETFLAKYGPNAILFLQGNTKAISPMPTTTDTGQQWAEEHPDIVHKMPNTYGFFAPPDGQFDYTAYLKSIQHGERVNLTPDQMVKLANDKMASMQYYAVKDALGSKLTQGQQSFLAAYHDQLTQKYPGFGTANIGLPQKANTANLIQEIQDGLKDPKVMAQPVAKAADAYLQVRQAVLDSLKTPGVQTPSLTSKAAAPAAVFLRNIAQQIAQKTPAFNLMFDRVFARELPDPGLSPQEVNSGDTTAATG